MLHYVTNRYDEAVYKLKLKRLPTVETSFIWKLETQENLKYYRIHVFINTQQIIFSLANMLETLVLVIYNLCVISDNCWQFQYHKILQVITLCMHQNWKQKKSRLKLNQNNMALRKRQLCSSAQPSDQYQLTQKSNLILNLHFIDDNKQYQTDYEYVQTLQKQYDSLNSC
ncbi:Hypothetical_protein [Hexamita inflata]|uniref:Hypothetical_protein n=1 Tax=Hexamita inflata TaxID=28002 RepID=A0AA86NUI3_9EUKA|nr:Hypothetical protein HINF_LOCUS13828 [Hexamita inflata]